MIELVEWIAGVERLSTDLQWQRELALARRRRFECFGEIVDRFPMRGDAPFQFAETAVLQMAAPGDDIGLKRDQIVPTAARFRKGVQQQPVFNHLVTPTRS